ncbi:MAG: cardiolipin synthase [Bacteroidota bacterium]
MSLDTFHWSDSWTYLFNIFYIISVFFTILVIIFEDQNAIKTVSWVLVVLLLPVLGIIIYLHFGRNFRKEKLFSRKGLVDFMKLEKLSKNQIKSLSLNQEFEESEAKDKANIVKLLINNSKALLTNRNHVRVLNNGKTTFDAIIAALESAKHHIHLEYYIYDMDKIGTRIADILKRKAKEGVEVRFIYDAVGSWHLKRKDIRDLESAGVQTQCFMKVKLPHLTHRINYRNHRKIVVVDGQTGFVGGINVADKYIEGDPELGFWRDTHLEIQGDSVQSLQAVFLTDWFFLSNEIVQDASYFPKHHIEEKKWLQITASGPDSDWSSIMQAYFTAITSAKHSIYISTPYFVPNESILTALRTAALSGVEVILLIPGKSDVSIQLWSTYSFLSSLMYAGVKVYIYEKGINHGKIMMVDGNFSSVGTANMDVRSFDKNFEVNALIYDRETTQDLEESFMQDLEGSTLLDLESFKERPFMVKMREQMARLLSPLF